VESVEERSEHSSCDTESLNRHPDFVKLVERVGELESQLREAIQEVKSRPAWVQKKKRVVQGSPQTSQN
jgi:hypothetical protein